MKRKGWTYLMLGHTKESVDLYTSLRILRNYPARRGIMLGNGRTYLKLGHTKESLDHYTQSTSQLIS